MHNKISKTRGYAKQKCKTTQGRKIKMRFIMQMQNIILGPNAKLQYF